MPAYFTRGSGHNEKGQYSERPDDYVHNMDRLARKFETARQYVPKPVVDDVADAGIGIIGYGTSHWAIDESRDQLERETGSRPPTCGSGRIRSRTSSTTFLDRYERIYVVEQNRDAQMLALMRLDLTADHHAKVRSVLHYNGLPIDARSMTDDILAAGRHSPAAEPHHAPLAAGIAGRGE